MKKTGIIQRTGSVITHDGNEYQLPQRGHDNEGYPEVLVDATEVGGRGEFVRQSVKQFVGMEVEFTLLITSRKAFNFKILKNE